MIGSQPPGPAADFRRRRFRHPRDRAVRLLPVPQRRRDSDSWEQHDGVEILFMRRARPAGICRTNISRWSTAARRCIIPARHRGIASPTASTHPAGCSGWCSTPRTRGRQRPPVPQDRDRSSVRHRRPGTEAPIELPEACIRNLSDLCSRLTDERLMIGSAPIMADVRSRIYSSVIELWEAAPAAATRAPTASWCATPRRSCGRAPRVTNAPTATSASRTWRASSATARAGSTACSPARSAWRRTTIASASASSAAARSCVETDELGHVDRHLERLRQLAVLRPRVQEICGRDPDRVSPPVRLAAEPMTRACSR